MTATITPASRVNSAIMLAKSFDDGTDPAYLFCGKIDPWDNEAIPDTVNPNIVETNVYNNDIIFVKRVSSSDCALAIRRSDWTSGVIYSPWEHDLDSTDFRTWLSVSQPVYVYAPETVNLIVNHNVYLCIDNNNGAASTDQPSGQATDVFSTSDGYKWKYIYDISQTLVDKYLSPGWLPVPMTDAQKTQQHIDTETAVTKGTVDRVRINAVGSGHTLSDTNIIIDGDGSGAAVQFTVDGLGGIDTITVTNPGSGYSWATATIIGPGSGTDLTAIVSPRNGHGSNAKHQLGAYFLNVRQGFISDESGEFPTRNSYRKVGLIKNIKLTAGGVYVGNAKNYFHILNVTNMSTPFPYSQRIKGDQSGAEALVFNIDPPSGATQANIYIVQKNKNFIIGETISLVGGTITATINTITINDIDTNSGELIYMENVLSVARKLSQSEIFSFVMEF